jgi:antitoxin component YwqK of YwqJK toxin-antitoxin module
MARDYTKYKVQGLGENLNKRQLVYTIVKDYIERNNPSLETLLSVFPDEIQGSKGIIRKESEVDDPKRFNMKEPLKIKKGVNIVVSNQWGGDNIPGFIEVAEKLNYNISFEENYSGDTDLEDNLNDNRNNNDIIKEEFYPNGQLKSRITFKEGIETNELCEYFYENGQFEMNTIIKDGMKDGTWESYYENGNLQKVINYKDNKWHGLQETYYENGLLEYRGFFKNDEHDGVSEMYHENGQLAKKMLYTDGQENGIWEYYDENGHLDYTESYKNGKYHGVNEYYDDNGNLRDKSVWEDGKMISSGL